MNLVRAGSWWELRADSGLIIRSLDLMEVIKKFAAVVGKNKPRESA